MRTINKISVISFTLMGIIFPCSDNFNSATLDSKWSITDNTLSKDAEVDVVLGELQLRGTGFDIYGSVNEYMGIWQGVFQGNFDISVKLVYRDSLHAWSQAGLLIANDFNDPGKGGYSMLSVSAENGVGYFYDSTGIQGEISGHRMATAQSASPIWIRVEKVENLLNSYYKENQSDTWTPILSQVTPQNFGHDSHVGLFNFSHIRDQKGTARFDDFECHHIVPVNKNIKKDNLTSPKVFFGSPDWIQKMEAPLYFDFKGRNGIDLQIKNQIFILGIIP